MSKSGGWLDSVKSSGYVGVSVFFCGPCMVVLEALAPTWLGGELLESWSQVKGDNKLTFWFKGLLVR